ncbi:MAG: site-specific DNA-methyltransferase [Proteobacteria bacterium]|nr:site-specific DNA-methyltransferase [Pseudomonadota bacterium]
MKAHLDFLDIPEVNEASLIKAARDSRPVNGLTHNFYRYPARFSPTFVRTAIEALSRPGDLVLDPFMGGGTSLVEALALGRHAVGVDISSLATFVASVKTTLFEDDEFKRLASWAERLPRVINIQHPTVHCEDYAETGYYKHLNHTSRWRLRNGIPHRELQFDDVVDLRALREVEGDIGPAVDQVRSEIIRQRLAFAVNNTNEGLLALVNLSGEVVVDDIGLEGDSDAALEMGGAGEELSPNLGDGVGQAAA